MGSIHEDRYRDVDRYMSLFIEKENQQRQYFSSYVNNGGTMTFDQWMNDGRYDPSDWGPGMDQIVGDINDGENNS